MGIVTDYPTLTAPNMITSYEMSWSIDVFFKGPKQLLGLVRLFIITVSRLSVFLQSVRACSASLRACTGRQ